MPVGSRHPSDCPKRVAVRYDAENTLPAWSWVAVGVAAYDFYLAVFCAVIALRVYALTVNALAPFGTVRRR
jgi:hypothetical protein